MSENDLASPGVPRFPPLLDGIAVSPRTDAFDEAVERAAAGRAGAGDVLWRASGEAFDVAVVLEPDVDARRTCQMLPLTMVAFADAVGAVGPADVGIFYRWPSTFIINQAVVGAARMAMSSAQPDAIPRFAVVGVNAAMMAPDEAEPGHRLDRTNLFDEGFGDVPASELISAFSRHFLAWVDIWQDDGFAPVHRMWTDRAEARERPTVTIRWLGEKLHGTYVGLDEDGNFLITPRGHPTRALALIDAVETVEVEER